MKTLQLSKEFVQVDGTVIFDEKGEKFTLKSFLLLVLGAHGAKDGKQAVELFTLAQDIYKNEADTIEVGDALGVLVQEVATAAVDKFKTLIIGQALKMLE